MSNDQEVYKHDSDLQKLIRPQWGWRVYFALFVTSSLKPVFFKMGKDFEFVPKIVGS